VSLQGAITEADIANYLANTPGFFERHAELMASIQLTSPHGQRAVSLQERQMEMLREKIKAHEQQIMEMVRHGRENVAIADRLFRYTRSLLLSSRPGNVPAEMVQSIQTEFMVPQAAVRLWGLDPAFDGLSFTQGVSDDVRAFTDSLASPYCGLNSGFDAVAWLSDPAAVLSTALIPLRGPQGTIGLLVLGSPDPTRYGMDMGTEFLARIGELGSAALSRLLPLD